MARYGADHKVATRRRMIETAGARFKREGIDRSGIARLVADAGLTNGAFYGHFESKNDLVAHVVAAQMAEQRARIEQLPESAGAAEAFVRRYLSTEHRDDLEGGCPSAALLDEIGKADESVRAAYTRGLESLVDVLAPRLERRSEGGPASRQRAIGLLTVLFSTLQLARAVSDPELSEEILTAGTSAALALLA